MQTVAQQKRQDHATWLHAAAALVVLATLTALPVQFAAAQGAIPCTAIDNDADRLECYDRALRAAPAPTPPAAAPAPPRSAAPPAAPATQTAAPTPPATPAAEPRTERRVVRETEARVAPRAPNAPAAGRTDDDDEEDDRDVVIPIVVVSTRTVPNRETTFTTDDGTRWVQTDNQRLVGLPDTPFNAEIKSGAMGSYFLVAKDRPRAVRVRQAR